MRTLTYPKIIHLIPSNYVGLKADEQQKVINKHSSIDIREPVSWEELELVIHQYSPADTTPTIMMYYFGRESKNINETVRAIVSETLTHFPYIINVASQLEEKWVGFGSLSKFDITCVGFCDLNEKLFISVSSRILLSKRKAS